MTLQTWSSCSLILLVSFYTVFHGVFSPVSGDLADLIFVFFDPIGQFLYCFSWCIFSCFRWSSGPDLRVLWSDWSGPVQAHAEPGGETEREACGAHAVLPQQGGRGRARERQTGQLSERGSGQLLHKTWINLFNTFMPWDLLNQCCLNPSYFWRLL